ncbi:MAG: ribokinase [Chthoniobacterales bacterium]
MGAKPCITIVGSLNIDHTFRVSNIPRPGESVSSKGSVITFGGKGANQALAAARAGARVELIGSVGSDEYGNIYIQKLIQENIGTSGIAKIRSQPTGSAFIAVDDAGENTIIVNPAANHKLYKQKILQHCDLIKAADILLMQLECPLRAVLQAAKIARRAKTRIVINPSPMSKEFLETEVPCDVLVLNENEAAELGNLKVFFESAFAKKTGIKMLVVTRGAKSTQVLLESKQTLQIFPPKVKPIDTVGAGDTFVGAFCVALAESKDIKTAIKFANAAGALATQKQGAQTAIPKRKEINRILEKE